MKTLINVFHPNFENSVINQRLIRELRNYPEHYTINNVAEVYSNKEIDVAREQGLIEKHENLILQFPIFWFSGPPLLKLWLDRVLTHGWAYGRNGGDKLTDRKIALAVTAGIRKSDYSHEGRYHYTMEQILVPFETTFKYYCHANYRPFFAFYGEEDIPGKDYSSSENDIEQGVKGYMDFLKNL